MRIKVVVNKKLPNVQKVDIDGASTPVEEKVSAADSNSPLMLVLEEDSDKTIAELHEEMENRLIVILELKTQIEKLLEIALDEYVKVQGTYQRLKALELGLSGEASGKPRQSGDAGGAEMVKLDDSLLEELKKDRIKQDIENLQTIRQLLKSANGLLETSAAISARRPLTDSGAKKKILIVEDDPISRRLLGHFLEKANYAVINAVNAEEGIQAVGEQRPDLILLDIMLPGADGFQFLSRIKENEATRSPSVFVISSLSKESDIVKALQAGATDYILKPFSPQVILAKINQHLRSIR